MLLNQTLPLFKLRHYPCTGLVDADLLHCVGCEPNTFVGLPNRFELLGLLWGVPNGLGVPNGVGAACWAPTMPDEVGGGAVPGNRLSCGGAGTGEAG